MTFDDVEHGLMVTVSIFSCSPTPMLSSLRLALASFFSTSFSSFPAPPRKVAKTPRLGLSAGVGLKCVSRSPPGPLSGPAAVLTPTRSDARAKGEGERWEGEGAEAEVSSSAKYEVSSV
jgi:hypothetical protein